MKARTLLKKLTDYGLKVTQSGDNIRLSPSQLVNDKVLTFVRSHKNHLLSALHDEQTELHSKKKLSLREGRLEVFRLMLQRYLKLNQASKIEDFLDDILIQFNYDLEKAINYYRKITPEPMLIDVRCQCGYMPPFCNCK